MAHEFQFVDVQGVDAMFVCTTCGYEIGFNLPTVAGATTVAVDNGNGTFSTPENPDQWSAPCTG